MSRTAMSAMHAYEMCFFYIFPSQAAGPSISLKYGKILGKFIVVFTNNRSYSISALISRAPCLNDIESEDR